MIKQTNFQIVVQLRNCTICHILDATEPGGNIYIGLTDIDCVKVQEELNNKENQTLKLIIYHLSALFQENLPSKA